MSQHGTATEKEQVKRAVKKRYPALAKRSKVIKTK